MRPGPIAALQEFDALLQRVAAHYASRIPPVAGHAPGELADRLVQRLGQLFEADFVVAYCGATSGAEQREMRLPGLHLNLSGGVLRVSFGLAARLFFDSLLRWCYSAFALAIAIRSETGRRGATLAYGIGVDDMFRGGSDAEFASYCSSGPIAPLREATTLMVQTGQVRAGTSRRIIYARSPLHALCRVAGLGPTDAMRLAWLHLAALGRLIRLGVALPATLLVARDFADAAVASVLNRANLIEAVVLTNSNYSSQPLWMRPGSGRKFHVHMVWYSQNIRPLLRRSDPELALNPVNRLIRADVMWVWTRGLADHLASIGVRADMQCVGPVLWRLPHRTPPEPHDHFVIAVFDVTPVTEAEALRLGLLDNYYSSSNARKFLQDIVDAAEIAAKESGKRVRIVLKHKRETIIRRDQGYFQFIEELSSKHDNLIVVPAQTSVYQMIANCDLAVAMPYSSPAYVASHLGKPCVFYDPTEALRPTQEPAPLLEFASGPAALALAVQNLVKLAR